MKVYTGSSWVAAYVSGTGYAALTGATFTGDVTVPNLVTSGNVDGRDVSVDGTKLDGIEANADVTDTTNVVAALTAGTNVTIAADGTISSTDTDTTYSNATTSVAGLMSATDKTKLDGIEANADATDATNVSAAGALMKSGGTMTGDINFGDNDKAVFGAGSDLQIYHNGTQSIIEDVGTGPLRIRSNSISIENELGTETISALTQDGAVTIYYDGSPKLATTSSGIDVTGAVTADGLTVDTNTLHVDATNNRVGIGTASPSSTLSVKTSAGTFNVEPLGAGAVQLASPTSLGFNIGSGYNYEFDVNGSEVMRIDSSGNVGIGTSTVEAKLDIRGMTGAGTSAHLVGYGPNGDNYYTTGSSGKHIFRAAGAESMRIDSSGRVGIGTTPDSELHIERGQVKIRFGYNNLSQNYIDADTQIFRNGNGASEAMRIDSSGNLLVGTTDTALYNNSTTGTGFHVAPSGWIETAATGTNAIFNKLASDGTIAEFRKDGAPVGNIGTVAGDVYLANAVDVGLYLESSVTDHIAPCNISGAKRDAAIDLGSSSARFRNAYFSGTVSATSYTGDGSSLTGIAAGATGGGSDEIFWENGQTVTTNYTITNGKNAMSAGPITINTGVTVTVGTGETWTVV
jgi:hypothetical protein